MFIVIDDPLDDNETATWVHVCGANPVNWSFRLWVEPKPVANSKPTAALIKLVAGLINRAMPLDLVDASEKSIIRAIFPDGTAGVWVAYIQNVIVAVVIQKYVSVGSVRKLMYAAALGVNIFPPLM